MRLFNTLVFDEYVPVTATSSSPMYISSEFSKGLGKYDSLAIQAVTDTFDGGFQSLAVAIEHSADGRNWTQKNGYAELSFFFSTNAPSAWGYDPDTAPSLGFVRLRLFISSASGCHVKLYVTGRSGE
jgi:hypothetical protein